jgi:phosphocarrier protein
MVASKQNMHKDVVIRNELGLHARSAAQIAKIVQKSKANVWIKRGREKVDASSIMDILTLACEKGTTITVIIEDPSNIGVLDAVVELVNGGFGE